MTDRSTATTPNVVQAVTLEIKPGLRTTVNAVPKIFVLRKESQHRIPPMSKFSYKPPNTNPTANPTTKPTTKPTTNPTTYPYHPFVNPNSTPFGALSITGEVLCPTHKRPGGTLENQTKKQKIINSAEHH
eukprot:TRINITY_DN1065_c0_g2_i9.p1 TRINITY_DN1065_c0_g2~~TRINITY_DN1065_c0_g2_i9.p1  ORF type:complete len:130 (-),score=24.37 TRINITY_DN1065_c0_g2_i9:22-411(-)